MKKAIRETGSPFLLVGNGCREKRRSHFSGSGSDSTKLNRTRAGLSGDAGGGAGGVLEAARACGAAAFAAHDFDKLAGGFAGFGEGGQQLDRFWREPVDRVGFQRRFGAQVLGDGGCRAAADREAEALARAGAGRGCGGAGDLHLHAARELHRRPT